MLLKELVNTGERYFLWNMSEGRDRIEPAQVHKRVRRQHSDELAQDYVEAIRDLRESRSQARVVDLQEIFGVSHVSVIRALKRLEERGLVERTGEGIQLTTEGTALAVEGAARHELVVRFLCAIGVSRAQAEADAEGVEHHISKETLKAMERVVHRQVVHSRPQPERQ